jgi:hypothetical protein
MDVLSNPGSVIEFYWKISGWENVSFYLLRSFPVLIFPGFPKLSLLSDVFLFSVL